MSRNSRYFIIVLIIIAICGCAIFYIVKKGGTSNHIADNVFRLHVIANSDTVEDQNLKYKVRDNILQYMNSISQDCNSKSEIIELVNKNKDQFYNIARKVILENGYNYDVKIKVGNFDFPTKNYGDISLPAGNYEALRIEIGNASGQNWWCVMFPPLCFVDVTTGVVPEESKTIIKDNLSDEEYSIVSDKSSPDIKFKFSLIEMFQNFKIAK